MFSGESTRAPLPPRAWIEGREPIAIEDGWEATAAAPGTRREAIDELEWIVAAIPGTAAGAMRDAGRSPDELGNLDSWDWWFRCRFEAAPVQMEEEVLLVLDGIATVAEVFLNGEKVLASQSMFAAGTVNLAGRLQPGGNQLEICCRALAPLLAVPRRPRARWRTKLAPGGLRFFRTMLLGRAPGFAPGPAAVGPWRPVRLARAQRWVLDELRSRPRLDGREGVLDIEAVVRELGEAQISGAEVSLAGPSGEFRASLRWEREAATVSISGSLRIPGVARWWPHTHGEPDLHEVGIKLRTSVGDLEIDGGRVGFRQLSAEESERGGFRLRVNGVPVFARGAIWTPVAFESMNPTRQELRKRLVQARDAGMNMLRIPGTGAYESPHFHDLCDELGLLLWQDFMFANFDYPVSDPGFREEVENEVAALLAEVGDRPSLAVLCGNSEVEQQAAMLGLDPMLARGELFGELLPRLIAAAEVDVPFVPSVPSGGALSIRTWSGAANYFGVGGYRRALEDARHAEVGFAAECLAFANVPDEEAIAALLPGASTAAVVHHPAWKAGVPRDSGAGWDFDDVRDFYLELVFGADPIELRRYDHDRYLDLSRAVTGEVIAGVIGEWRRPGSPCRGALVLWLGDLRPGAGWGVLDHSGLPKCAYHHLRRALAPLAVWTTDEGLNGIGIHVANDGPTPMEASLRVALYAGFERRVAEERVWVELPPHSAESFDLEEVLGRFADASWAYRFGPPAQDLIAVALEGQDRPGTRAFSFPAGRPLAVEGADALGLTGRARVEPDGVGLELRCHRFVWGLRLHGKGLEPNDNAISLEPGVPRMIELATGAGWDRRSAIELTALNMQGRLRVPVEER